MRKIKFANGEYYHVYNRGVDKREVFIEKKDFLKFKKSLKEFNNNSYYAERKSFDQKNEINSFLVNLEKVVEIVAYSLNPNHFHLILKQLKENGIANFMHKIGTSFTKNFNKKYERSGSLFQGTYKATHVNSNQYLAWLSAYVNGNIEIHGGEKAEYYKWSSYKSFLSHKNDEVVDNFDIVLSQFKDETDYKNFVERVIRESKNKKEIEKYMKNMS